MLLTPEFRILDQEITYTGAELRPHWGLENTRQYGSLITAFIGPCDVQTGELVDMEDRLASDFIRAASMLHFIGEFYGTTLEAGVLYQRLLINWAEKLLREQGVSVERIGDDLICPQGKMSVSIATVSSNSVLIHWGINWDSTGAPVKATGLKELLGWDRASVLIFAKDLLTHYIGELKDIQLAAVKVRAVN